MIAGFLPTVVLVLYLTVIPDILRGKNGSFSGTQPQVFLTATKPELNAQWLLFYLVDAPVQLTSVCLQVSHLAKFNQRLFDWRLETEHDSVYRLLHQKEQECLSCELEGWKSDPVMLLLFKKVLVESSYSWGTGLFSCQEMPRLVTWTSRCSDTRPAQKRSGEPRLGWIYLLDFSTKVKFFDLWLHDHLCQVAVFYPILPTEHGLQPSPKAAWTGGRFLCGSVGSVSVLCAPEWNDFLCRFCDKNIRILKFEWGESLNLGWILKSWDPGYIMIVYQVLPSDPLGGLKWPFQGLSDLHLGD